MAPHLYTGTPLSNQYSRPTWNFTIKRQLYLARRHQHSKAKLGSKLQNTLFYFIFHEDSVILGANFIKIFVIFVTFFLSFRILWHVCGILLGYGICQFCSHIPAPRIYRHPRTHRRRRLHLLNLSGGEGDPRRD